MGKIMRNGVQYGVDTADVLSTVAECDASASGGKGTTQVASAKALSELNSNLEEELGSRLGGLRFGVDAEGNYGYKKAGADTVTPFKSSVTVGGTFTVNPSVTNFELGFKPRSIMVHIAGSNPTTRLFVNYCEDLGQNICTYVGNTGFGVKDCLTVSNNGFSYINKFGNNIAYGNGWFVATSDKLSNIINL